MCRTRAKSASTLGQRQDIFDFFGRRCALALRAANAAELPMGRPQVTKEE
jgi:hypothetical protein